jgi:hypothetical protein
MASKFEWAQPKSKPRIGLELKWALKEFPENQKQVLDKKWLLSLSYMLSHDLRE